MSVALKDVDYRLRATTKLTKFQVNRIFYQRGLQVTGVIECKFHGISNVHFSDFLESLIQVLRNMSNSTDEVKLIRKIFNVDKNVSAILFYVQNILLLILACYCLISNSIFVSLQRRLKVLPQNIKKFMIILTYAVVLQCLYIILHCLYNFFYAVGLTIYENEDIFVKERWTCALIQSLNISCIATINTAALAVAVELVVTTYFDIKYNSDQEWSKSHKITYVSAFLVWCTNLYPCTEMFVHPAAEVSHQYCYFTLIIDIKYSIPVSIFLIIVEIVTLGLFAYSYRVNSKTSILSTTRAALANGKGHSTLNQRFKVQQNLNLSKSFLIWSSIQSCTYVISVLLRLISSIFHDRATLLTTVIVISSNFQFYVLFNLFNPYLQIKNNKMMRRQLFNYLNSKTESSLCKISRFLLTWSLTSTAKVAGESTALSIDLATQSKSVVMISPKMKKNNIEGPVNYRLNPNHMTDVLENFWNVDINDEKGQKQKKIKFGVATKKSSPKKK
uniref:G-protein coupled receptors family 1 profile domain-containing protein n=1 Tax=Romanomermis culicivorax TaxID=13658 RepID=A0A915JPY1_ROMCU